MSFPIASYFSRCCYRKASFINKHWFRLNARTKINSLRPNLTFHWQQLVFWIHVLKCVFWSCFTCINNADFFNASLIYQHKKAASNTHALRVENTIAKRWCNSCVYCCSILQENVSLQRRFILLRSLWWTSSNYRLLSDWRTLRTVSGYCSVLVHSQCGLLMKIFLEFQTIVLFFKHVFSCMRYDYNENQ